MSRIILPEHSIILPGRDNFRPNKPICMDNGMGGEYKCILYEPYPDGSLKPILETDWTDNVITHNGLEIVHTGAGVDQYSRYTCIGGGSTAADVTDTQIETFLGVQDGIGAGNGVVVNQASPNWEHSSTLSRRFDAGTGTGTVTEVTLGVEDDGTNIFSRIVLPTPIDKGLTQILDVIYRMTVWPFTNDVIGVSTINGVDYDTITRGDQYGSASVGVWSSIEFQKTGSVDWRAYDGDANDLETTPSGSFDNFSGGLTIASYVPGSHESTVTANAGLDDWVLGSGIRTILQNCNWFRFKTQYNKVSDSSRIIKLSSEVMDTDYTISWNRH